MPKIKMVELDPKKLNAFLADKTLNDVDDSIGKAHGYTSNLRARLKTTAATYGLLCRTYGLAEDALLPDPPAPEPEPKPEAPAKPANRRSGYWLDLADNGNHVVLRLMYGDEQVQIAKARVKGGEGAKELDFVQAISYAAHMIYKFAEQDDLGAD